MAYQQDTLLLWWKAKFRYLNNSRNLQHLIRILPVQEKISDKSYFLQDPPSSASTSTATEVCLPPKKFALFCFSLTGPINLFTTKRGSRPQIFPSSCPSSWRNVLLIKIDLQPIFYLPFLRRTLQKVLLLGLCEVRWSSTDYHSSNARYRQR